MPNHKPLLLVADDDPGLLRLMSRTLELADYRVLTAADGTSALAMALEEQPDLVVLDIRMPGLDGFEVCRRIRQVSHMPIIMVTARAEDEDKVQGLDDGADDYVTKPFGTEELLARVQAILRRSKLEQKASPPPLTCGELVIDLFHHRVSLSGQEVELTPPEYWLLFLLARNAGRVLLRDYLLEQVWGREYTGSSRLIEAAVSRLQQKLGDDPQHPKYIVTKMGIGYKFLAPSRG